MTLDSGTPPPAPEAPAALRADAANTAMELMEAVNLMAIGTGNKPPFGDAATPELTSGIGAYNPAATTSTERGGRG